MAIEGKVIWITGASSGIGEALAIEMAHHKTKLVLSARRKDELERVKSTLPLPNNDVMVLPLDMELPESFDDAVKTVIAKFGKIDVLVNNAGISQRSLFKDTDLSVVKRLMNVNFYGPVALTKAAFPYLTETPGKSIVLVTSVVGKFGTPKRSAYAASKHAVHGFFDALRAETWQHGLHVMLVMPGYVKTAISINALVGDGKASGKMDENQAKGLQPSIVAKAIIKGIENKKREIVVAGFRESLGVWLKRFFPSILAKMVRNVNDG